VIIARVVGKAIPAASPVPNRATLRTTSFGAQAAMMLNGLASVAVADRAEPEHGGRQAQREPDRDEVQGDLRRVERIPDRGERHVRDGEVEVGDRRHEDQGEQDLLRLLRRGAAVGLGQRSWLRSGVRAVERGAAVNGQPRRAHARA
jgi:hypothetical protein